MLENLRQNKLKFIFVFLLVIASLYFALFHLGGSNEKYLSEKYRSSSRKVESYFDIDNNLDYILVRYMYSEVTKRFTKHLIESSNLKDKLENYIVQAPNFDGANYFDYHETESVLKKANERSRKFYNKYGNYWEPIKYRSKILRLGMKYYSKTKQFDEFKEYYLLYNDFSSEVVNKHPEITSDPLWEEWSYSVEKMHKLVVKRKSNNDTEAKSSTEDSGPLTIDLGDTTIKVQSKRSYDRKKLLRAIVNLRNTPQKKINRKNILEKYKQLD